MMFVWQIPALSMDMAKTHHDQLGSVQSTTVYDSFFGEVKLCQPIIRNLTYITAVWVVVTPSEPELQVSTYVKEECKVPLSDLELYLPVLYMLYTNQYWCTGSTSLTRI